jgi:hypothetical protein
MAQPVVHHRCVQRGAGVIVQQVPAPGGHEVRPILVDRTAWAGCEIGGVRPGTSKGSAAGAERRHACDLARTLPSAATAVAARSSSTSASCAFICVCGGCESSSKKSVPRCS